MKSPRTRTGNAGLDTLMRALDGVTKQAKGTTDILKQAEGMFMQLVQQFARQTFLGSGSQSGGGGLSGIGSLAGSVGSGIGDVFSDVGDFIGDLFFAKGGAFDAHMRPLAFATGGVASNGVVDRPTLFPTAQGPGVMGEAGPEAILPLSRTSNGQLGVQMTGSGGGSSTVVISPSITLNASGGSASQNQDLADRTARQSMEALRGLVRDELARAQKPGGQLNQGFST